MSSNNQEALTRKAEAQITALIDELYGANGVQVQELIAWERGKDKRLIALFKGTDGENYQFFLKDKEHELRREVSTDKPTATAPQPQFLE